MSWSSGRLSGQRLALSDVLRQAHFRVAMIAVLLAGFSVFVVGLTTLHVYMVDNLALAARGIAYTVEAAVVFDDRDAANESLSLMASNNPIASAHVLDLSGAEIAGWKLAEKGPLAGLESGLARLLLADPAVADVMHDGARIGTVQVYGSGREVLIFLAISLISALLCLGLSAIAAHRLSRRASLSIVEPLQRLARVVSGARHDRHFHHRVAAVGISELQDLGDDVNALLEELERWQAQVKSESESLEHQASHDPLTGLANRSRFESSLQKALLAAEQNKTRVAVFFIDADRFKTINDELGHEAGDAVLCAIASRLKAQLREGDLVARLGGDEFAVLLSPLREADNARRVADNILACMQSAIALPSGGALNTTLSIGIALYPEHASDAVGLLKRADDAMYQAKRTQRGSYHVVQMDEIAERSGGNQ